eukprot:COSAG01_NODE_1233_length_11110_cov_13.006902_11_plen_145_part_00
MPPCAPPQIAAPAQQTAGQPSHATLTCCLPAPQSPSGPPPPPLPRLLSCAIGTTMQWQPAADGQRKMQKQPRRALTVLICLMTQTRPSRRREALYTTPKAPRPSTSPSRNWSARKAETAEAGWRRLIPAQKSPPGSAGARQGRA